MATANGSVTNAAYGFASMLSNLLKDHRPDKLAVGFDLPGETFRHRLVEDYKGGRAETPDILIPQFEMVKNLIASLGIRAVECEGYEADDVLATLAHRAAERNEEAIVVSGDRDTFQLVSDPYVRVLYNRRGVTDYSLYDEKGILERTGVLPSSYVEYAALRGDPSDNLKGVTGVGEKTAAKLINEYGGIEEIYAHLDDLPAKLRGNLTEAKERVAANVKVMKLVSDLPLEFGEGDEDLELGKWDRVEFAKVCQALEFKSLRTRIESELNAFSDRTGKGKEQGSGAGETSGQSVHPSYLDGLSVVSLSGSEGCPEACSWVAASVNREGLLGVEVSWEGDVGRSPIGAIAMYYPGAPSVLCVTEDVLEDAGLRRKLSAALASGTGIASSQSKELLRGFAQYGVLDAIVGWDISIAAYLLNPSRGDYSIATVSEEYAGVDPAVLELGTNLFGVAEGQGSSQEVAGAIPPNLVRRLSALFDCIPVLEQRLEDTGMSKLFREIELPLSRVLAKMEILGVRVDVARLEELNLRLSDEARALEGEIQDLAGVEFKVNSTQQLRDILFVNLGLSPGKKNKTGYSTDQATLEKLRGEHPIIDKLLRYREVEKLRSTYGKSLIAEVAQDGRIHATFNQTVARTGRISSERPNLHNIPVRTEDGRLFRTAFIPSEGRRFMVADYNQIELRIIAHLSGDPGLVEAFGEGRDIHRATAARVFSVPESEVTFEQRSKAKMVSYGLAYGMEAFGLASRLGIPVDEASKILKAFFEGFPLVHSYMETTVKEARDRGYTLTEFGRRRMIPELTAREYTLRQIGERQAMNAAIQGLAADIFKLALIEIDKQLNSRRMASQLVLQVHDEMVIEVPPDEEDLAKEVAVSAMMGAANLKVPLEVNVSWGATWADAKG